MARQHAPDADPAGPGAAHQVWPRSAARAEERRRDRAIPVIIVSAYGTLMNEQDAHQAVGVIQKPFDYDDLVGQVERATARTLAVAAALS